MDFRVGAKLRALRQRRGWRQRDLAARAGVSQGVISLTERGRLDLVSLDKVRRVAREMDAEVVLQVRWRGGDLDRLLDEGHAALAGSVIELLAGFGWLVKAEVSYSEWGERGSIDILAWHPERRTLLVIEVKTELVSVEETLRKHDEKTRLARKIAREQFGWQAETIARLLVLPDLSTQRRRIARHDAVFRVAAPTRGSAVKAWLKAPTGSIAGILFMPSVAGSQRIAVKRVRLRKAA